MRVVWIAIVAILLQLPVQAQPEVKVKALYSWIFQGRQALPWREVLADKQDLFEPHLYVFLSQAAHGTALDFNPFLDCPSSAEGFSLLRDNALVPAPGVADERTFAEVDVDVHKAVTALGLQERHIKVELSMVEGDWRISNFRYRWAEPQDLLSFLKRNRGR